MKRTTPWIVMALLFLCVVTAEAQPHLTFIQGSNQTRAVRGKHFSVSPPSWNPITEPSPQQDGSYRVGDWESGSDKYIDGMAMQWNLPTSLSTGANIDSVRLTIQYSTSQSLKLEVKFFHADYEIQSRNRDDLFLDIVR